MNSSIEATEEQLRTAMINSDVKVLDELLADDLLFTNHLGLTMTKEDDLTAHRSGFVKIESIDLSDMKIRTAGDVSVVSVTSRICGEFGGQFADASFRFMRVWEKREEQWKLRAAQSTLIGQ